MVTSSNNKIEDILRQYTSNILPPKSSADKAKGSSPKPVEDSVTISDEGRKRMKERFQNDVITYLRTKY